MVAPREVYEKLYQQRDHWEQQAGLEKLRADEFADEADQARQQADAQRQQADIERQRVERLLAQLRALGMEPDA